MMRSHRARQIDVIISGAGPCGLALAILCARRGFEVLVCERGQRPGPEPRAETVYDDPMFDDLLGPGFLPGISLSYTSRRRFYSPGAAQHFEICLKGGKVSHVFEWRRLIDALHEAARGAGVRFRFGAEVTGCWCEGPSAAVAGVELAGGERLRGGTVFGCDGARSLLGRQWGVDYERLNCRITKTLVDGFRERDPTFQYFLIAQGEIPLAPDFPPAIAFVFPREPRPGGTGLYLPRGAMAGLGPDVRWPSADQALRVWRQLRERHPVLSDLLTGCRVAQEHAALLPAGGRHRPPMVRPGLALLGDSIGFLEATGASGLLTSIGSAYLAVELLAARHGEPWTASAQAVFNRDLERSALFRQVGTRYRLAALFHQLVFRRLRTAARINRAWPLIRLAYALK